MPRFDAVLAELPRLRRYAFCLYGSRATGDARIQHCLQRLVDQIHHLDGAQTAESLFRFFHSCEATSADFASGVPNGQDHVTPVHAAMMRLTVDERRVLGLVVVSGFSLQDTADILGVSVRSLSARLRGAKRHLRDLMPRAIIIEDEYLLASQLTALAREIGVTVCGTAADGRAAEALAREYRPDLVLADVLLSNNENGADIAEEIRARYDSAIVYVTAYPDRVRAQPSHHPFIVRKPVLPADLAQTITRACDARLNPTTVH